MILENTSKRACIYFIYDGDGIIDRYVIHQLQDLRKNVDFLHCVVNGKLTDEGKTALLEIADEVFVRENKGNDIGAYKASIAHIGWDAINAYDELIFTNNTNFGPIYPFKELFDWAKQQDVDFWGLCWDQKGIWLEKNDTPHRNSKNVFINSCFLALRKSLLETQLIKDFFDEIPDNCSYLQSGMYFEHSFPGYFEERGYRYAVYCDTTDDYNYPMLHDPVRLFKEFRMPLFKKRSFSHHYSDVLYNTAGEATAQLMQFLQDETDYDMNMIWDSVLRTRNLADVIRCAQLNRVLPRNQYVNPEQKKNLSVGLVYHAYYTDLFDEDVAYIDNFPTDAGVLVTTSSEEKKFLLEEKLEKVGRKAKVIVIGNRGRDVSSLLVSGADFVFDYDLICFGHDKKAEHTNPRSVGRSWAYKVNENTFASKEYVANIIDVFEKEERLGIAFPPYPLHNVYANINTAWTENFAITKKLLDALDVHVKIDERTLCVAPLGTCFWFRPKAMKKLFAGCEGKGWCYEDFPGEPNRNDRTLLHAIERSYAYVAQDAGYYPAFIYNDKYTQIELTNLEFNKAGSHEMRYWVNEMALQAIHFKVDDNTPQAAAPAYYETRINYGIKESLRHLSFAIRCKFPVVWKLALPFRIVLKKILGIKPQ